MLYMHWYKESCRCVFNTLLPPRLLILQRVQYIVPYYMYNRLPEDEPLGLKHVEGHRKLKY